MVMFLVRGKHGSGKTTAARKMTELLGGDSVHVEADEWEESQNYQPSLLGAMRAFERVSTYIEEGRSSVVVSGVFATDADMQPYVDLAARYGWSLLRVACYGQFSTHFQMTPGERAAADAIWEEKNDFQMAWFE